jgi:hypothetical protein
MPTIRDWKGEYIHVISFGIFRDVNGLDNFCTKSVVESVSKNLYPVYRNPTDKDIRFRSEHRDMVCKITSNMGYLIIN